MLLLLAALCALALHILLGWQWSLIGGIVAGYGVRRFAWAAGMIVVALSWILLVVYNFAVAPAEMARFVKITSGLFGNMPGPILVLTTILIGALLGVLGGIIGGLARNLTPGFRSSEQDKAPDPEINRGGAPGDSTQPAET